MRVIAAASALSIAVPGFYWNLSLRQFAIGA